MTKIPETPLPLVGPGADKIVQPLIIDEEAAHRQATRLNSISETRGGWVRLRSCRVETQANFKHSLSFSRRAFYYTVSGRKTGGGVCVTSLVQAGPFVSSIISIFMAIPKKRGATWLLWANQRQRRTQNTLGCPTCGARESWRPSRLSQLVANRVARRPSSRLRFIEPPDCHYI